MGLIQSSRITFHGIDKARDRRKIRLLEGNANCRHVKKLTCKGTLRQVFICLTPRAPFSPTPFTHCIRVYSILIHTGKEGGGRVDRGEGEGQQGRGEGLKKPEWLNVCKKLDLQL